MLPAFSAARLRAYLTRYHSITSSRHFFVKGAPLRVPQYIPAAQIATKFVVDSHKQRCNKLPSNLVCTCSSQALRDENLSSGSYSKSTASYHHSGQLTGKDSKVQHRVEEHFSEDYANIDSLISLRKDSSGIENELSSSMEEYTSSQPQFATSKEDYQLGSRLRAQASRSARKRWRKRRSLVILDAMSASAKDIYLSSMLNVLGFSHRQPHNPAPEDDHAIPAADTLKPTDEHHFREPVTVESILARHIENESEPEGDPRKLKMYPLELKLLQAKGYTEESIRRWTHHVMDPNSRRAVQVFQPGAEHTPFFLLLLFLRRKSLTIFALCVIMRHFSDRFVSKQIVWADLKLLVIQLIRHGRSRFPESLPWISSLFVREATRLRDQSDNLASRSPQLLSDMTKFCNKMLLLLSLPGHIYPILFARIQEQSQRQILQFMVSASRALVVSRLGFRSVITTQVARPKTDREKEWARLKSLSWPPWKVNQTAMDEDKRYEFGVSRASKILHRMYEAGYSGTAWESLVNIYAGWDTDQSPTIQTRTSLPGLNPHCKDRGYLRSILWAARIRATRTRREAWACFLEHERSTASSHPEIYLAMFEKICYPVAESLTFDMTGMEAQRALSELLPGEMKEVFPDPLSPLDQLYISEPVPSYEDLLRRMGKALKLPSRRLLCFLLDTCPRFDIVFGIFGDMQSTSNYGVTSLVFGQYHDRHDKAIRAMPGLLFASFIRYLCRFGDITEAIPVNPYRLSTHGHLERLESSPQYRLEYAHTLLMAYRPKYRPAWTAYMNKMNQQTGSKLGGHVTRYRIMYNLLETMEELDLDVDDETFQAFCTATMYAAWAVDRREVLAVDAHFFSNNASVRLRELFESLVGLEAEQYLPPSSEHDMAIPSHIPDPAGLHTYVRALGSLRNYRDLYCFTVWLVKHHKEVTIRAEARHSGNRMLFKMLVALRAAMEGKLVYTQVNAGASAELIQCVRELINRVDAWGGWPSREHVDMYLKRSLRGGTSYSWKQVNWRE